MVDIDESKGAHDVMVLRASGFLFEITDEEL